jgi:photosystem II stability/assembly factor-like uncharacterized protein
LQDRSLTSLISREGVILAGSKQGVLRSDDGGAHWRDASAGLTTPHVRWLALHPAISDLEFAGTEPAGIFVSHNGGGSWRTCPEVAQLRDKHTWSLPYSPEAGCIRGFAFSGRWAYAAAEVGGVLVSEDAGETWRLAAGSEGIPSLDAPAEGLVHPDLHSISVDASSANLVFAPTGGGFFLSRNGGRSWAMLYDCYCRAVWIDPLDAEHMLLGPADGVDRDGRIEETRDGGRSWQPASDGLLQPWRNTMVERFSQVGDQLLAILSNGQLYASQIGTRMWRRLLTGIAGVTGVADFAS